MKEFEIWMEGYRATGEDAKAVCCGVFPGLSFDDAVQEYLNRKPELRKLYQQREKYLPRNEEGIMVKIKTHQIWALGLYDNEVDARKANG